MGKMEMPSFPKNSPYRNRKILDLAAQCEYCCVCGQHGGGSIVACHSNAIEDGHGMGQKAHDIPCFGCAECHSRIDGRIDKHLTRGERRLIFYRGVYNTWLWMMKEGYLEVK